MSSNASDTTSDGTNPSRSDPCDAHLLRLTSPAYTSALQKFVETVERGLAAHTVVGKIRTRKSRHGGVIRNVAGPNPLDHPLMSNQAILSVPRDAVRQFDTSVFTEAVVNFGNTMNEQRTAEMLRVVSEVAEKVGNSRSLAAAGLKMDNLLDMIEQIEIGFNLDGSPNPVDIVDSNGNPVVMRLSPDQVSRLDAIMHKKKESFFAQKRHRRIYRCHK